MDGTELGREFCRLSVEGDRGTASRLAAYFNIAPGYAVIPTGTDGLHCRFFRGEPRSVALDPVGLRVAVAHLTLGKDPVQKAIAETSDGSCDAWYFCNVDAGANDHKALHPPVIRPPGLDRLLDVRRRQIRRKSLFDEDRYFCVGGKAQRDKLTLGQPCDL